MKLACTKEGKWQCEWGIWLCRGMFEKEWTSCVVSILISNLQIKESKVNREKVISPKAGKELRSRWAPQLHPSHHVMPSPKARWTRQLKLWSLTETANLHSNSHPLCMAFLPPSVSSPKYQLLCKTLQGCPTHGLRAARSPGWPQMQPNPKS